VQPRGRRPNVLKHLDESATSVALNIAEGNGKRSLHDRIRYLEIARGSALECAACLDVLVARSRLASDVASQGKATLVRIVSTITKLIERHLRDARHGPIATSYTRLAHGPAPGAHATAREQEHEHEHEYEYEHEHE
jgi:four helix bundle protein